MLLPCSFVRQVHSATLDSGALTSPDLAAELSALKQRTGWQLGLSLSGGK
jgi:hypothetical protein